MDKRVKVEKDLYITYILRRYVNAAIFFSVSEHFLISPTAYVFMWICMCVWKVGICIYWYKLSWLRVIDIYCFIPHRLCRTIGVINWLCSCSWVVIEKELISIELQ